MKKLGFTAFTLAEVLVTLGIIGVVASITIPVLMNNVQDNQLKIAWKKSYSVISQAVSMLSNENSGDLVNITISGSNHDDYMMALLKYLSYMQFCAGGSADGPNGCFNSASDIHTLTGGSYDQNPPNYYTRAILKNGQTMLVEGRGTTCSVNESPKGDTCFRLLIDVNGFKPPNVIGKDTFGMVVTRFGQVVPYGTKGAMYGSEDCSSATSTGWSCSAQYLYK